MYSIIYIYIYKTLRDDDICSNYISFRIIGSQVVTLFFMKMAVVVKKTVTRYSFISEALLINYWQYFPEFRPLSLSWIFKCKNL